MTVVITIHRDGRRRYVVEIPPALRLDIQKPR